MSGKNAETQKRGRKIELKLGNCETMISAKSDVKLSGNNNNSDQEAN